MRANVRLLITTFILLALLHLCHFLAALYAVTYADGFTLITLPILLAAAVFALVFRRFEMLQGKPVKRGFSIAGLTLLTTAVWVIATYNLMFGTALFIGKLRR